MSQMPVSPHIAAYVDALAANRTEDLTALLGEAPVFQSPFSLWETPALVHAAFAARTKAFSGLQITHVSDAEGFATVLWQAFVGDEYVEGCEVLSSSGGRVTRVDVFLRPANALKSVYAAMSAAWPRPGEATHQPSEPPDA